MTKSALLVYGGWEGHTPKASAERIAQALSAEGYEVRLSDTLDAFLDADSLKSLSLIIPVWTMDKISKEQAIELLEAVKSGVGIGGWHGCMADSFRDNTDYQFMVGGQWVAHPGNIIDYEVNITNHTHRITARLRDFKMHSEQYYMHVDPSNQVLATTTFGSQYTHLIDGCVMPVVWPLW